MQKNWKLMQAVPKKNSRQTHKKMDKRTEGTSLDLQFVGPKIIRRSYLQASYRKTILKNTEKRPREHWRLNSSEILTFPNIFEWLLPKQTLFSKMLIKPFQITWYNVNPWGWCFQLYQITCFITLTSVFQNLCQIIKTPSYKGSE